MAELTGHPRGAAHDLAALDNPAAEPGADDRRDRRTVLSVDPEEVFVGVQRGGVAIVVVDDRQSETGLGGRADVIAVPYGLLEVGRTP